MTLEELVDIVKTITLEDLELNSFYIGNTWDHSAGKRDLYPNLWFEMPVFTSYVVSTKLAKTFTFSVSILEFPSMDNTESEIKNISICEVYADKFLSYLRANGISINGEPSGLSIKSVNADNACGIRLDLSISTPRECLE